MSRHERRLVLARRARLLLDPDRPVAAARRRRRGVHVRRGRGLHRHAPPVLRRRGARRRRRDGGFGGLPRLDQPALGLRRRGACRGRIHRGDRDAPRARASDLATGIVLGAALGLAALFLYFDTTHSSTTGASITVLFGSLFVIDTSIVPAIVGLSAAVLGLCSCSTARCFSRRSVPTSPRPAASASVSSAPLPRRDGGRRLARRTHDRRGARYRAAHRPAGHRAPARETARARRARRRGDRRPGDLARHPPRLRQLLLAACRARLAGQLPRRRARLRLLPPRVRAHRRRAVAAA